MRVLLKVRHRAETTDRTLTIGKTVTVNGVLALCHTVPQLRWRSDLNAPYGLPALALDWMRKMGVRELHLWEWDGKTGRTDNETGTLYAATLEDLHEYGIRQSGWDGLCLVFLPLPLWTRRAGRPYDVPWNETVIVLESGAASHAAAAHRAAAHAEVSR